ncbi:MAG: hypothetical protein U1E76_03055 [Planctomycetota bacterium]
MRDTTRIGSEVPPDSSTAFDLFLETLDFSVELAVVGTMADKNIGRDQAVALVFQTFAEEDRRRVPSLLRMLRLDANGQ